jgi:hypothetical protein
MMTQPTFDAYHQEWLSDVKYGNPHTSELGHRFARKLITQWLDIDEAADDIVYCDGAGDGGIDIAYLHRADTVEVPGDSPNEGDVWYLVQSKYGSAFQGVSTLLEESQKVIQTLSGQRANLSSLAEGLQQRLNIFQQQAGDLDRLILTFATETPLTDIQKQALEDIRAMGRNRLGPIFDVETVSIATIYQRVLDEVNAEIPRIHVPLSADLVASGRDLLVGAISLLNLYGFLKDYRSKTGDIDQLYEKNVRRFLGSRGKVNKAMQNTLRQNPEQFGLYNNGITIVVEDFIHNDKILNLVEPYVVNGCQTTRTIWEVFHQRLEAGGTGSNLEQQNWRNKAQQGVVVVKIVKVGAAGDNLLEDITRYTNSQNAVREKDFLVLRSDFRLLARQMEDKYNVFLETQRGGWESRSAYQRQHPKEYQFTEHTNAFDLLKVYSAGWLGEAGTAYGRNAAFLPGGNIFGRIFNDPINSNGLSADDLYAAYQVQKSADNYKFGRGADKPSRRQTRFLFYMVVLDMLKGVMNLNNLSTTPQDLTAALIKLYQPEHSTSIAALMDIAIEVIDEYMNSGSDDSVFREPAFQNTFNSDLNGYLKWEQLGKSDASSPNLRGLLAITKRTLGRGSPSPRDLILGAINKK